MANTLFRWCCNAKLKSLSQLKEEKGEENFEFKRQKIALDHQLKNSVAALVDTKY